MTHEAAIPNPALQSMGILVGDWSTVGSHPQLQATLDGNVWRSWRNSPGFSQRFTGTLSDDGRTIVGKWELSKDGVSWDPDLELTYTRVE